MAKEEAKFNVIIAEAEKRLQLQQQTILLNKTAISRNTAEMKIFSDVIKGSNAGLLFQSNLNQQNLKLQVEITAERAKNAQINAKITEVETQRFMSLLRQGKEVLMQDEEFQKNRPAIIGAIFIPQISSVAAKPKKMIKILFALITQLSKSLDSSSSTLFIKKVIGSTT